MKTKFDESDVSEWCNWIAVDKDGECWEFKDEPEVTEDVFSVNMVSFNNCRFLYKGEPPKSWKNELYEWRY